MKRRQRTTTSEVGSPPPSVVNINNENDSNIVNIEELNNGHANNDSAKWQAILEAQNKTFLEMIKMMSSSARDNGKAKTITLPKFNSDSDSENAAAWCATVDLIMSEHPLEGSALIIALSGSLQGSASKWLSQICYAGITWENFKELFTQRFQGIETMAATTLKVIDSRPNAGECLSAFASRLLTTLTTKWQNATMEEIAVSLVLAQTARHNKGLQRLIFTKDIKTRNDLQQELRAFAFEKKNDSSISPDCSEQKKTKLTPPINCHYCGKIGHKMVDCRLRKRALVPQNAPNKKPLTCFKCGIEGHIASKCTKSSTASIPEKKVYTCGMIAPKGRLTHEGELFQFYFDSGSDCSLVKETIVHKFRRKRHNSIVALRGLGNAI